MPIIRIEHSAYFIPFLKKLIISQCKSRWLPVALLLFKIKEGACIITILNYVLHFTVQLSTFSKFKKRSKPLQEQNKIKLWRNVYKGRGWFCKGNFIAWIKFPTRQDYVLLTYWKRLQKTSYGRLDMVPYLTPRDVPYLRREDVLYRRP